MKNLSEKQVGLGGFSFSHFLCLFVSFNCLFFVALVSFFLLSFTFVKFLRRHIVIFILKFILCTSVLCLLYVYIENKIKTINLKKKKNCIKFTGEHLWRKLRQIDFLVNFAQFLKMLFPCRHTTSFQRQYDVVQCRTTSYRRWKDIVCLRGYRTSLGGCFCMSSSLCNTSDIG